VPFRPAQASHAARRKADEDTEGSFVRGRLARTQALRPPPPQVGSKRCAPPVLFLAPLLPWRLLDKFCQCPRVQSRKPSPVFESPRFVVGLAQAAEIPVGPYRYDSGRPPASPILRAWSP